MSRNKNKLANLNIETEDISALPTGADLYLGVHTKKLELKKDRRKKFIRPIFLFSPDDYSVDDFDRQFTRLCQIVNVYEHNQSDFEFNARNIINHFKKYYGDTSTSVMTLGQSIRFRVHKKQKEPFELSLFQFLVNYTLLLIPVLMGANLENWKPWSPEKWTAGGHNAQMNKLIRMCRSLGSPRRLGECIEWSKYLMDLYCANAGDRIGLSISNHDFYVLAERSPRAKELMNCEYKLPDDLKPSEIEYLKQKYTKELLDIMAANTDLPISIYARNGLFNPGQAAEFFVMQGFKPDLYDHTIPMTHKTNIIKGLKDPVAFMVDAYGGRKAEVLKLNVSDAGALERSLTMLLSGVRFVDPDYECSSMHFRIRHIENASMLDRLDGRVATLDPKSDEYFIIDPEDTSLLDKTLYVKTPITCTHPRRSEGYICSACYGKLMANLNCDIHIGKVAGLNLADEMEQKLLSAKHALNTNTNDIVFDDIFNEFFDMDVGHIHLNTAMIDESEDNPEHFDQLFLEFHLESMKKNQDGEGRHYDRSINEIIVYDKGSDARFTIAEESGIPIYLSPEFAVDIFKYIMERTPNGEAILVPFTDLVDHGKILCNTIFEYQYENNGIAKPLNMIQEILGKTERIQSFGDYNNLLNGLAPLFLAGGIHLPEFQLELLVGELIFGPGEKRVDWTLDDPEYHFCTIDKAIYNSPSPITSILYHESSAQLGGKYGTYDKSGTSVYDWFMYRG